MRQLCVDICINHGKHINPDHTYDTKVSVASIIILTRTQQIRKTFFVKIRLLDCRSKEIHITICRWIIVHYVGIRPRSFTDMAIGSRSARRIVIFSLSFIASFA